MLNPPPHAAQDAMKNRPHRPIGIPAERARAWTLAASMPFEMEAIPYRKVGKDRRIRMEDAIAYKVLTDHEHDEIIDELAADTQENEIGYERL